MTTIQLTDAQLAQFTATGLIVVDGESTFDPVYGEWNGSVAPELWRKMTEPCPTCNGTGGIDWKPVPNSPNKARVGAPCPTLDCDDGRQIVTLTATCPTCEGKAKDRHMHDPDEWEDCPHCVEGVVTLGRFTIRLLPVVGEDAWTTRDHHVEVTDQGVVLLHGGDGTRLITTHLRVDPLPQSGQWAVQFEAVE